MKTKLLLLMLTLSCWVSAQLANKLVHEFKFNNSYTNEVGSANTATFPAGTGISLTTDRFGNADSAISIVNTSTFVGLNELPLGQSPNTVTFWAKFNSFPNNISYPYAYGQSSFYNSVQIAPNNIVATGSTGQQPGAHFVASSNAIDTWNHYAFVYDGFNSLIYKDGVLLSTAAANWIVQSGVFRLGANQNNAVAFDGAIDDLQIYNFALTDLQVSNLFNDMSIFQLIYHFPFNGDMNDVVNNASLTSTVAQTYESNGTTAASALTVDIVNSNAGWLAAPTANLPLLPVRNLSRTLAMRVNFKTSSSAVDFIAFWGTSNNGQAFGFEQSSTLARISGWGQQANGFSADYSQTFVNDRWYSVVVTLDRRAATLYIDGVSMGIRDVVLNTVGTDFVLGRSANAFFGSANYAIDDLKIYNYALSQSEVTALTLSTSNQEETIGFATIYPNPTNHILNVEMIDGIKSVTIYNLQGQQVMTSNDTQINVANLAADVYILRVESAQGAIVNERFIKNNL